MVTINKINLKQNDSVQRMFLKNLKTVLEKIGTSHKTKALHKLISEGMVYIGYGAKDISKIRSSEYGTMYLSGNKLSGLIADISSVVDPSELVIVSKKVKDIEKANKELQRVKTTITDTSAMQINNLDNNIKELFEDLIDSINYFILVDIYYYLYINSLAIIGLKGNGKNKIFDATYNVFKVVITKILTKLHVRPTSEEADKIEIIMDYVFATIFTDQTSQTTISKLTKLYSAEKVEFLRDLKVGQYKEFKNIATILTKSDIVNMTESSFMNEFRMLVGNASELSMSGTFDELIAYIISANYKSSLFDAPNISVEDQERLEQLILNFKKDLILTTK